MSAEMFFLDDLAEKTRGFTRDARLKHPFLLHPVIGSGDIQQMLRATFAALDHEVIPSLEFHGDRMAATVWSSRTLGHELHGMTLIVTNEEGRVEEARILLRHFQLLARWRARLQDSLPAAPGWELPTELAVALASIRSPVPGEPLNTTLPFALSDDAQFHGPAFVKPVVGAERVRNVVGQARTVYGACDYSPLLHSGAYALRAFTSKLPLEIASISHLTPEGSTREISVFMQPWPTVAVFCDGMRARLAGALDPSFFELESGGSSRPSSQEKS